jgi:nucleotide-binding universal stress UspA family protein
MEEDFKRILAVSRVTEFSGNAINRGISLAKKYGAELYVLLLLHDPFALEGWNLPIVSLKVLQEEHKRLQEEMQDRLSAIINRERAGGMRIEEFTRWGEPLDAITEIVESEKIDLLIFSVHEKDHIDHYLFAHDRNEIVRKIPCSILLLKEQPKESPA